MGRSPHTAPDGDTSKSIDPREASAALDVEGMSARAADVKKQRKLMKKKKKNRSLSPDLGTDRKDFAGGEVTTRKKRQNQTRSASPPSPLSDSDGGAAVTACGPRRSSGPYVGGCSRLQRISIRGGVRRYVQGRASEHKIRWAESKLPPSLSLKLKIQSSLTAADLSNIAQDDGEKLDQIIHVVNTAPDGDTSKSIDPREASATPEGKSGRVADRKKQKRIKKKNKKKNHSPSPDLGTNRKYFTGGEVPTRKKRQNQRRSDSPLSLLSDSDGGAEAASGETSAVASNSSRLCSYVQGRALEHKQRLAESKLLPSPPPSPPLELKTQSSRTAADLSNIAQDNGEKPVQIIHVINNEEIEGLEWSDAQLADEIDFYVNQLNYRLPDVDDDFWRAYDGEELKQLNERLALHRIKAHEISKGALLERLVDAKLEEEYPQAILEDNEYFERYERDYEWYFDPKCMFAGFEDYQRLALRNNDEYLEWDNYHETYCTYKADQEFVEFCEKLSSKTKWLTNSLCVSDHECPRYERLAFYQAAKIAAGYKNISLALVHTGLYEHIWSIKYDHSTYGAIASLYFEIWKRVAKRKMSFVSALKQVYDEDICAPCRFEMKLELDYGPKSGPMKINYDNYVACINVMVHENEAYLKILEAVKKFVPKLRTYYDYARKKLDIARKFGLIPLQKAAC